MGDGQGHMHLVQKTQMLNSPTPTILQTKIYSKVFIYLLLNNAKIRIVFRHS